MGNVGSLYGDCLGTDDPNFVPDTDPLHVEIMHNAWWFWYEEMRDPDTKLYADKINSKQVGRCCKEWIQSEANPVGFSTASIGFGLVLLCVGVEMGYLTDLQGTADEAQSVIELLDKYWPRGAGRFLKHWGKPDYSKDNYKAAPFLNQMETSTIDTAIAALGAAFAANYFQQKHGIDTVSEASKHFMESVDWPMAIKPDGVLLIPEKPNVAKPFNEYFMVCYIAHKLKAQDHDGVRQSFEWNWLPAADTGDKPPGAFEPVHFDGAGRKIPLLGGNGHPMSSFVPQFPAFLCKDFAAGRYWRRVIGDYLEADLAWWADKQHREGPLVFGSGPGQSPDEWYAVDKVMKGNPTKTFSPAIMAGFLIARESTHSEDLSDARAKINQILDELWSSKIYGGAPYITHTNKKILWRCSTQRPGWKPNLVVMDFANFPLGYATNFLGLGFYQKYAF